MSATSPKGPRSAAARFIFEGLERKPLADLYHFLLTTSWPKLLLLVIAMYTSANALFAGLYLLDPNGLENARPGSFLDAFFFSVQTSATIGYGKMVPTTVYTNALVAVEALGGMLMMALATGLTFAKFSRPTARVLFSNRAVIHARNGLPSLVLRVANGRGNQLVDTTLRLWLLRDEVTAEGETVHRVIELPLARAHTPMLSVSWTVHHPITPDSPLAGMTAEDLTRDQVSLLVALIGIDESSGQTMHARTSYAADDIVFGMRFADTMHRRPDGRVVVDFRRFHELVPARSTARAPATSA